MKLLSKKLKIYLPEELISSLKLEAAHKDTSLSELISLKIYSVYEVLCSIESLSELINSRQYANILRSFAPSSRGRSWNRVPKIKKSIGLYFSEITIQYIENLAKHFSLSNSSTIELTLLISHRELNSSIPLFDGTKLYESEFELLQDILKKTGAESISEFLHACNYDWIIQPIKKEIEDRREMDN